jgi:hypothetical protein
MACSICKKTGHNKNSCTFKQSASINEGPAAVPQSIPTFEQIKALWAVLLPIITAKGPLMNLGHTLLKKEHGKRPGGMGTGAIEEDLWTTQFAMNNLTASFDCVQADCCIKVNDTAIPMSIKCTSGGMATNWGKNKTKVKFVFTAPVYISYHRPARPGKARNEFNSGIYLVDPEWCNANVEFESNNKTDYLISKESETKMLQHAKDTGMFQEIVALEDKCTHFVYRDAHNQKVYVARNPSPEVLLVMLSE